MSALISSLASSSTGSSVNGLGPHVEELRAFFKTRGVTFGSVEDLKPFVDRLDADAGFHDEIASMIRAIIYRERDGLSWPELVELLTAAVGGEHVEDTESPEVREAVRGLMAFVESVFRTRRNPGAASVAGTEQVVAPEPEASAVPSAEAVTAVPAVAAAEAVTVEAAENVPAEHPKMDVFYRARMAAKEEEEESFAGVRRAEFAEKAEVAHGATEPESLLLHKEEHWHVPLEDFGGRQSTERGSPVWLWVAGMCALLLAFSAGLFVRQQMIMPLRSPNQPYEAPPADAAAKNVAPAGTAVSGAQPAAPTVSEPEAAEENMRSAPGVRPRDAGLPASEGNVLPRYLAPATIGASPALMASRLLYAPPPVYPMMAEMTHTQGKVTVEAVVGKNGRVIRAKAIGGHRLLRGAAVREVYQRRYRPYLLNDRPADVATIVTVDFRLK